MTGRSHTKKAPEELVKVERDARPPLKDDVIAELLATAARAAIDAAPRTKGAPDAPPRVNHPPEYAARRAAYHQLPDRQRRACLLLHLLDEAGPGGRLDHDAGAALSTPHATSSTRRDH